MDENSERLVPKAARYLGQEQEDDGLPWMEHLEKEQKADPSVGSIVQKLDPAVMSGELEKPDSNVKQQGGSSLLDGIKDPRSMAREQDGPGPRDDIEDLQSGSVPITHFMDPERYGEGSSMKYWWDSKNRNDNNTGTAFGQEYTGLPIEASLLMTPEDMNEAMASWGVPGIDKQAASLNSIVNASSSQHKLIDITRTKASNIDPVLESSADQVKKGILLFSMKAQTGEGRRFVAVQFLKPTDGKERKSLMDHDCLVACSCPAFLFWGPQYYAITGDYMYKDMAQIAAPPSSGSYTTEIHPGTAFVPSGKKKPVSRGQNYTFCKHIYAVSMKIRAEFVDAIDTSALLGKEEHTGFGAKHDVDLMSEQSNIRSRFDLERAIYGGFDKSNPIIKQLDDYFEKHQATKDGLMEYIRKRWMSLWVTAVSGSDSGAKKSAMDKMISDMDTWATAPQAMLFVMQTAVSMSREGRRSNLMYPHDVLSKAWKIFSGFFTVDQ